MNREEENTFKELYQSAVEAGKNAVMRTNVRPMVVYQRSNPLDDKSEIVYASIVEDGVCGFANIIVKPANSKFAKWLLKNGYATHAYGGGVSIYVSEFNQSLQRKEAYAYAFADTLRKANINAYVESRLD